MTEQDLQDVTRMHDTHVALNSIIKDISNLNVFPPLVWVWAWDVLLSKLRYYAEDTEEYKVNEEFSEADIFTMFWQDADLNGFSLQYGSEQLEDDIFDWMLEKDILVLLDEDGWLDE